MKNLLYIAIFMLLFTSCSPTDKEIAWSLPNCPEMLVVESIITNELKEQSVHLTYSMAYFDTLLPTNVSGASLSINDGSRTITFHESTELPGWYFSDLAFVAEQQKTYTLNINLSDKINGVSEYSATSKMPLGLEMDSMKCEIYKMPEFTSDDDGDKDTTILGVYYFGQEPQTAENFYFTKVYRNNKLLLVNPKEYFYYRTDAANATYTHQDAYLKNVAANDTILFRLYTIGKDYYDYLEAIQNMDDAGNAYSLAGPPAKAVGNISEGKALGYFLAAYVSEKKALAIDKR